MSDTIVIGKCHEIPEFVNILPGQVKVLMESIITLECEVRGGIYKKDTVCNLLVVEG